MSEMPPLGVKPEWLVREHRLTDLFMALGRYAGRVHDKQAVLAKWVTEAQEHLDWLRAYRKERDEKGERLVLAEKQRDALLEDVVIYKAKIAQLEEENARLKQAIEDNLQAHKDYVEIMLKRLRAAEAVIEADAQTGMAHGTEESRAALRAYTEAMSAWQETKGE